ncbi:glycosyltransferase family 9 protein [Pedobacter sp. SYP-B3415]|uniref:glycosyltransferase family 9 protein n=1 Tax=Pedobacter sp. SYP-B3415 TaxID=2496641 RepID=UPI00101C0821|nr:glycosyltransferase family 9 protein [Pedobacter sp. SYP-B3415]
MTGLEKSFRIGILRALQLGDLLCSIPAIRALRSAYPEAHIELIGLPGAAALTARYPQYINALVPFPGYPGLPEQTYDQARFVNLVAANRISPYDLLLQMQGNGSIVNEMLAQFNAKRLVGFCPSTEDESEDFMLYPAGIHEVDRHLQLMQHTGIAADDPAMEFPVWEQDRENLSRLMLTHNGRPYICVHPGSRGSWRQWPVAHFARMADLCIHEGFDVILTGVAAEQELCNAVADSMRMRPQNACGLTDLGTLAAVLEGSAGLLCNCTGISHLAAALKVPSVVISMDGEPRRWGPRNTKIHQTLDWKTAPNMMAVLSAMEALIGKARAVH